MELSRIGIDKMELTLCLVMIHATGTDVVVLTIAVSSVLQDCEIWVEFVHGSRLQYIPCHLNAAELGSDVS